MLVWRDSAAKFKKILVQKTFPQAIYLTAATGGEAIVGLIVFKFCN